MPFSLKIVLRADLLCCPPSAFHWMILKTWRTISGRCTTTRSKTNLMALLTMLEYVSSKLSNLYWNLFLLISYRLSPSCLLSRHMYLNNFNFNPAFLTPPGEDLEHWSRNDRPLGVSKNKVATRRTAAKRNGSISPNCISSFRESTLASEHTSIAMIFHLWLKHNYRPHTVRVKGEARAPKS